jgi:ubiquinone/menaquinone biosynthesis C-methylase UbiE
MNSAGSVAYFMEDPREGQRLADKLDCNAWIEHFLSPHLQSVCSTGGRIVDVGCGPATILEELARRHPTTDLVGIDASPTRITAASELLAGRLNARAIRGDASALPLPDDSADLVLCRFVLEYLAEPRTAIAEMLRICRPGGLVLMQDLDGQLVWHDPPDPYLEHGLAHVMRALAKSGFDPHVGRKLYHLAHRAGATTIQAQAEPYHLIAGGASERELVRWRRRFEIARPAICSAVGARHADRLINRFLAYLARDDSLTYSILFTVTAGAP